jgi:hypothetical protein
MNSQSKTKKITKEKISLCKKLLILKENKDAHE